MARQTKTRETVAQQFYLNTTDIMTLLGCSWRNAKRTFTKASQIDDEELPFRVEPLKVRKQTVLRLAGITSKQLESILQVQKKESLS